MEKKKQLVSESHCKKEIDSGKRINESKYQAKLIKKLKAVFPGCFVLKNDATYLQGIPDLLILYKDKWAMLECKKSKDSSHRTNQDYYINELNANSFARFVYPENEEEVLNDLQQVFRSSTTKDENYAV